MLNILKDSLLSKLISKYLYDSQNEYTALYFSVFKTSLLLKRDSGNTVT